MTRKLVYYYKRSEVSLTRGQRLVLQENRGLVPLLRVSVVTRDLRVIITRELRVMITKELKVSLIIARELRVNPILQENYKRSEG